MRLLCSPSRSLLLVPYLFGQAELPEKHCGGKSAWQDFCELIFTGHAENSARGKPYLVEIFVFSAVGVLITKGRAEVQRHGLCGREGMVGGLTTFCFKYFLQVCRFEKPRAGYLIHNFFEIMFNTFFPF